MSDARILDRGYRRYEGERSGVAGAVRSVAWHTVRSILGLGRKGRHKVFPIIVLVISFVPAAKACSGHHNNHGSNNDRSTRIIFLPISGNGGMHLPRPLRIAAA